MCSSRNQVAKKKQFICYWTGASVAVTIFYFTEVYTAVLWESGSTKFSDRVAQYNPQPFSGQGNLQLWSAD